MLKKLVSLVILAVLTCSVKPEEDEIDIKEMAKQIKALQAEVTDLKQRVQDCESTAVSYVSNYQNGLADHKILTFDSAILNDGNAYNNNTGIFTSPVSGVYLVSFFIADRDINQVLVQLTVDNTVVSSACAETIQSRHIDQGGNVVLVRLTKGQNMWVEVITGNAHIESHTAWRFTTFSAVLLYEL